MLMKSFKRKRVRFVFACAFMCMGLFACGTKAGRETESVTDTLPAESLPEIPVSVATPAWTTEADETEEKPVETTPPVEETTLPAEETTSENDSEAASADPTETTEIVPPELPTAPPVVETAPPIIETTPPIIETAPPVVETAPPIIETTPPVIETVPPIIETEPPTEAPTAPVVVSAWYTTSTLNLRESPSLSAKVILTIPKNTAVDCLAEGPDWHLVTYGGATGYVASGYLADEALITFPGYGETAYAYVRYINDHFSVRLNGNGYSTKKKEACGAWIERTMNSLGYTATYHLGVSPATGVAVKSYAFRKSCGAANAPLVVIGAHYDSRESRGAEDNGTGVGMVLELAQRYAQIGLPYDIDFCFWDGEELQGCAGSYFYVKQSPDIGRVTLYINLDCLGAGDHMFAYGGDYVNGKLVRAEAYTKAMEIATRFGIPLRPIPAGLAEPELQTPTRLYGSDQDYFARAGIPYLYFEANAWIDRNGAEQYPAGQRPYQYNSVHAAFADTFGTINHTKFDDLDVLERIVPGRIQAHMSCFAKILYTFLEEYR
ncbi:MAG: M28 family peptidase [Lachnospiraceae bacterium]|nr:M28 family peptidase [Lachnospiraceae bacterium]